MNHKDRLIWKLTDRGVGAERIAKRLGGPEQLPRVAEGLLRSDNVEHQKLGEAINEILERREWGKD